MNLIDPLEGIELEGTHILRAGADHPNHNITAGDRLIIRPTDTAPDGALVVADMGGVYTLVVNAGKLPVHGVVVGVVRKVGGDES